MSENDNNLIKFAFETDEWSDVSDLLIWAESEEAKLIIHDRMVHLYDKEEAFAGIF